ncbi:MAG: DUF1080 domain-containing protein [Anaerohalosphaera sp.]|nr:DUF1080 domain-containing protein [Anaerohalosphaera sp.]
MKLSRIIVLCLAAVAVVGFWGCCEEHKASAEHADNKEHPSKEEHTKAGHDTNVEHEKEGHHGHDGDKWISLFNGKDLDGWKIKITGYELGDNFNDTFRVEDGLMKVSYDKYDKFGGRFGHIFYEQPFSHYKFRVEYRFVGEQAPGGPGWAFRNSGVMIHGQTPESMGKDQKFPVSIEVQLLGGDSEHARTTGNLCTPGTNVVLKDKLDLRHCINSTSKTYHGDQWVTMEIEVHGNEVIKHIMDGEVVLEYKNPQLDTRDGDAKKLIKDGELMLSGGSISLQAESHGVEFRKVEIMPLHN